MRIRMKEPAASQFIYINPTTNIVHVLVPIVGGDEISTDNTCKSTEALKEFFEKRATEELFAYQYALNIDLLLLEKEDPQWVLKKDRLLQIETYLKAIHSLQSDYLSVFKELLKKPSNLYEIQLRPSNQDFFAETTLPIFEINRKNNKKGKSLSALINAMTDIFKTVNFSAIQSPRARITRAVLAFLTQWSTFSEIQDVLRVQFKRLFKLDVSFDKDSDGNAVTQEVIDVLMCIDEKIDCREYVAILLNACVPTEVWNRISVTPFYNFFKEDSDEEKINQLSMVVQFFLASTNVYCRAKKLSQQNFGLVLDSSPELSEELIQSIAAAINHAIGVEKEIIAFLNKNASKFGLSRFLFSDDVLSIKQKFERMYSTVTATKENPHMDDFKILDKTAQGENAYFVSYKGYICGTLAKMMEAKGSIDSYFQEVSKDFIQRPLEIPLKNVGVNFAMDLEIDKLITRIDDDEFGILPSEIQHACFQYPIFSTSQFLHDVAKGRQNGAANALFHVPLKQELLLTPGIFKDYSGREFHCTAYEYAYWAKDYRMCLFLESHMDDHTKLKMANLVDEIDNLGLAYKSRQGAYRTPKFDLTQLKTMLKTYIEGHSFWLSHNNMKAIEVAWRNIGKAQRDLPAHMIQEYCRAYFFKDKFSPASEVPYFYHSKLSRLTSWDAFFKRKEDKDLALIRGQRKSTLGFAVWGHDKIKSAEGCAIDLEKICQFDTAISAKVLLARDGLRKREAVLESAMPAF